MTAAPTAVASRNVAGGLVVASGASVLLLARPALLPANMDPTVRLLGLFAVIGIAATAWPTASRTQPASLATAVVVTVAGVAAFGAARLLGGTSVAAVALRPVVLNTVAAVAEEALFRRLLYGLLRPAGAAVAVAGSAAAFAAVHLTVWGAWVLPLDLAAGLLLGWQREATGRWSVPAVTHAAANLLAVL